MQKIDILLFIREFGVKTFLLKALRSILYSHDNFISNIINNLNEHHVLDILTQETNNFQDMTVYNFATDIKVEENPIWIMWYQGEENAPEIVKKCIENVKKHSNGHKVIVITEDNLEEYVVLPSFIKDKFKRGKISRTHLSDIIRLILLTEYGGLWIDSTVYTCRNIDDNIYDYVLYSINTGIDNKDPSHGRWTTFFMAAKQDNELLREVLLRHLIYWNKHEVILDYIAFDYFVEIARRASENNRHMIEKIPRNNKDVFKLRKMLNLPYIGWDDLKIDKSTYVFKLSWKEEFLYLNNQKKTVYAYLMSLKN